MATLLFLAQSHRLRDASRGEEMMINADAASLHEENNSSGDLASTINTLRQNLPELTRVYKVKSLAVFGSRVRGDATASSDLDILVEFSDIPTLFEFVRLQRRLSELTAVEVDLVMKSGLKPTLGQRILREVAPV